MRKLPSPPHNIRIPGKLVFKSKGGVLSNWDRVTKWIQHDRKPRDWHRQDLREWAATTMVKQGVPIDVYECILSYTLSSGSAARRHYDRCARIEKQRKVLEAPAGRLAI